MRFADLMRKRAQNSQRINGIAGDKNRKSPHDCERSDGALQRVWMDVGHLLWPWPLQQNGGAIRTSSERGGLRKQPAVGDRYRKVCVGLPLDQDLPADEVVPDDEMLYVHIEVAGPARQIEECRATFRVVDAKHTAIRQRSVSLRLEGKAKGPRSW